MKTLSLIFLTILPSLCWGQYFSYLHDADSSSDMGAHLFLEADSTFFILGAGGYNPSGRFLFYTQHISGDGSQLINAHAFKSPIYSYYIGYTGRARRLSSGYISNFNAQAPSANPTFGTSSEAMLAKFNAQGDTIFYKSYTDTLQNWDAAWDCNTLANGDYIFGGERAKLDLSHFPAVLWRTDSNGTLQWVKEYEKEFGNGTKVNSIDTIGSNKLLIGIESNTLVYLTPSHFYYRRKPWFTIMDTSGSILKDTLYSAGYSGGGTMFKDNAGGYFHYGTLDSLLDPNYVDEVANFPPYIAHLDTNFQIQWITKFFTPLGRSKDIWAVKQLRDTGYVVVGTFSNYPAKLAGWIAKIDKNGNVLWDNIYEDYPQNHAYLTDIIERPDGNFTAIGSAIDLTAPSWRQYDTWILGIDSNGCEVTGCTPTPTVVQQMAMSSGEMSLYPNPTDGHFVVEAAEEATMQLYDVQGRMMCEYKVGVGKTALEIPTRLTAGVYLARLYNKSGLQQMVRLTYEP